MSKYDIFFDAQRRAFSMLDNANDKVGDPNLKVDAKQITAPATLIQEIPLTTASNILSFDFSNNAPGPTAALNNKRLGENDLFTIYGYQMLIGQGATVASRIYRAFGPSPQDNAPYNGELRLQLESNIAMKLIDTQQMRKEDGTKHDQYDGAIVVNPLRTITGRVATFNVQVIMGDISALVFTANLFVSMRLLGVVGQAKA